MVGRKVGLQEERRKRSEGKEGRRHIKNEGRKGRRVGLQEEKRKEGRGRKDGVT